MPCWCWILIITAINTSVSFQSEMKKKVNKERQQRSAQLPHGLAGSL